jgi:hypothetical protein
LDKAYLTYGIKSFGLILVLSMIIGDIFLSIDFFALFKFSRCAKVSGAALLLSLIFWKN